MAPLPTPLMWGDHVRGAFVKRKGYGDDDGDGATGI